MRVALLTLSVLAALLLLAGEEEAAAGPATPLSDGTGEAFVTFNFARAVGMDEQGQTCTWDYSGNGCPRPTASC